MQNLGGGGGLPPPNPICLIRRGGSLLQQKKPSNAFSVLCKTRAKNRINTKSGCRRSLRFPMATLPGGPTNSAMQVTSYRSILQAGLAETSFRWIHAPCFTSREGEIRPTRGTRDGGGRACKGGAQGAEGARACALG